MNIDREKIEAEKRALEANRRTIDARLSRLDGVLAYIEEERFEFPLLSAPAPEPAPAPELAPTKQQVTVQRKRRETARPGPRKAVLKLLHTGPATSQALARVLAWSVRDTKKVIHAMVKDHLCFLNEAQHYQLSRKGKMQAEWFLDPANEEYVHYMGPKWPATPEVVSQ
jgi:hypothetical protein